MRLKTGVLCICQTIFGKVVIHITRCQTAFVGLTQSRTKPKKEKWKSTYCTVSTLMLFKAQSINPFLSSQCKITWNKIKKGNNQFFNQSFSNIELWTGMTRMVQKSCQLNDFHAFVWNKDICLKYSKFFFSFAFFLWALALGLSTAPGLTDYNSEILQIHLRKSLSGKSFRFAWGLQWNWQSLTFLWVLTAQKSF